jgi:hypothetical protein
MVIPFTPSFLFLPRPDDLIILLPLEVLVGQDFLVGKRLFQLFNQTDLYLLLA